MRDFVYTGQASRVVFGAGSLVHLEREVQLLGARRALILCTPEQQALAENIAQRLGSNAAGIFAKAVMHVPAETAAAAVAEASRLNADCALAVGGGSTTGLGKAIALQSSLPILAIPTTYAGSEMTPIYGITENGIKKTGRDARVLPRTVIYDPELSLSLPLALSVTSAMNAIAHAAEGLYAQDSNPVMDLMAEEGIRALATAIPALTAKPQDINARSHALYGAWLCGTVLGNVGMALHHKLCHTLGGTLNLPHAEVHTVILPHAIAFNAAAAPEAMQRIARALQSNDAALGLYQLAKNNGAPTSLRELGMRQEDIDKVTQLAVQNPYWNPRPIGIEATAALRALLQRAFDGLPPDSSTD
jgi:alcohol dehydrogenase class IV